MRRLVALLALALVALPPRARGQVNNAQISADAVVVTVGMTIVALRNLDFGTVPRGLSTAVAPNAANAGAWQATGGANAFVSITFTLPTVLNNVQAVPGVTMPIGFSPVSALWRRATNDPNGATTFDPSVGTVGRFGPPPNPTLYLWIGGTVSASATQLPGIYQGAVIVSLAYL